MLSKMRAATRIEPQTASLRQPDSETSADDLGFLGRWLLVAGPVLLSLGTLQTPGAALRSVTQSLPAKALGVSYRAPRRRFMAQGLPRLEEAAAGSSIGERYGRVVAVAASRVSRQGSSHLG